MTPPHFTPQAGSGPDGAPSNRSWNLASGPGTVVFATPTAPVTTATFTAPGTCTLRLPADDGFGTGCDEVVITVGEPIIPDGDIHHVNAIVPASAAASHGRRFVLPRGEPAAGSASQ